jgi:hypothetical protein
LDLGISLKLGNWDLEFTCGIIRAIFNDWPIVANAFRATFPSEGAGRALESVRTGALKSKDDAHDSGGE